MFHVEHLSERGIKLSIIEDINEVASETEKTEEEMTHNVTEKQKLNFDLSFLQAKTGAGSIEDYIEHPMNIGKSKGMAQLIRGFTGLFGALDLAIIDITVGLMQFTKEKKVEKIVN